MAFGSTFTAICNDPHGEAMVVRLYVRLNDDSGAPGTLVEITATQDILALNPITRKREREWGVVQGQAWQVRTTNIGKQLLGYNLKDCWCAIRAGFPVADVWETFAQGKIKKVTYSTGGTVTLEVHDAVMDLLNFTIPRDIRYQATGWISGVNVISKASGSSGWDSTVPLVLLTPASADDETFVIEFTTATAYKVILEDGDETQTGTIGADKNIDKMGSGVDLLTIPSAGWDATASAYAAGDRFVFYTARPRTTAQLTPINMIVYMINESMGYTTYDVMNGIEDGWQEDTVNWGDMADASVTANHAIAGEWAKGTSLSQMIQDCLKVVHGAIFPSRTGKVGLWVLQPSTTIAAHLNGTPGNGPIEILDDATLEDDLDEAVSQVTYHYKTLDGEDATCTAVDAATTLLVPRHVEVTIGWEVRGVTAQDSCDKYLNRYKEGVRRYTLPTTLAGIVAEIGQGIAFTEGELDLDTRVSDVTDIEADLLDNRLTLQCHTDPVVNAVYFVLLQSLLNGAEVLW